MQNASYTGKFRASDFSSYGAWSNLDPRRGAYAFVLTGVAAGHHVEFVADLSKPNRRCHGSTVFLESDKRNIVLVAKFRREGLHLAIVREWVD